MPVPEITRPTLTEDNFACETLFSLCVEVPVMVSEQTDAGDFRSRMCATYPKARANISPKSASPTIRAGNCVAAKTSRPAFASARVTAGLARAAANVRRHRKKYFTAGRRQRCHNFE